MVTFNYNRVVSWGLSFTSEHSKAQSIELPHTSEVIHLYDSNVNYDMRGKGYGSKVHRERLTILENNEAYTLATCIVNKTNLAQIKILQNNGWKFLHEFPSKDGEILILCCRDIVPPKYDPNQQGDTDEDI